jgi:hypothetical protein
MPFQAAVIARLCRSLNQDGVIQSAEADQLAVILPYADL